MGVDFVDQTFESALAQLSDRLGAPEPTALFIANAATLNLACDDDSYRCVLNSADLVFGDGTGVRWAARARGVDLHANLNGTDLIPELIKRQDRVRVFLLGGSPQSSERIRARFAELFPNAILAGNHHGYFDHELSDGVTSIINDAEPDLLLVGFGNPLQERWIAANRSKLNAPLMVGVGGLFDFWTGQRRRAPRLMRSWGMEWLHILVTEPHKARRYLLGNPIFLIRLLLWLASDRRAMSKHQTLQVSGRTSEI